MSHIKNASRRSCAAAAKDCLPRNAIHVQSQKWPKFHFKISFCYILKNQYDAPCEGTGKAGSFK